MNTAAQKVWHIRNFCGRPPRSVSGGYQTNRWLIKQFQTAFIHFRDHLLQAVANDKGRRDSTWLRNTKRDNYDTDCRVVRRFICFSTWMHREYEINNNKAGSLEIWHAGDFLLDEIRSGLNSGTFLIRFVWKKSIATSN